MSAEQELKEKQINEEGYLSPEGEVNQEIDGESYEFEETIEYSQTEETRETVKNEIPEQEEINRRDREILAALDEVLIRQNIRTRQKEPEAIKQAEKIAIGVVRKGAGVVSLSLILIFMGVVMLACLFSASPDYMLPMKLSPIAAILMGLELLVNYMMSRKNFRVNIPCVCIAALIVVGSCIMGAALNSSYSKTKTEYNNRTAAAEIYERSYKELRYVADISRLTVEVELNPDGLGREKGIEALTTDDTINIKVEFDGTYHNPKEFADECKRIIDAYRIMGIPIANYSFVSESRLSDFRLNIDGKFQQDYTVDELSELVNHIYIEDSFVEDLDDFIAETNPAASDR